jgi:hypothetical protein
MRCKFKSNLYPCHDLLCSCFSVDLLINLWFGRLKASPGNKLTSDDAAVSPVKRKQVSDEAMDRVQSVEMPEEATVKDASEDEDEEDEELVYLPAAHGKLDPAVLASLPPSMQLDLLVQMREQLVAENRQKFEKVAKASRVRD